MSLMAKSPSLSAQKLFDILDPLELFLLFAHHAQGTRSAERMEVSAGYENT